MKILNLEFTRIAHDTFKIKGSKVVYTDPFKVTKRDEADIILLSHEHFDHLSLEDLSKVIFSGTTIVASPLCKDGLKTVHVKETRFLDPGGKLSVDQVEIEAVPAYNVNKFREPGKAFHPKAEKRLGFVFTLDGTRVYFAGDTDFIPEMKSLQCDVALLPISGTYVMTVEEAVEAAAAINPKIAVPMHYAAIVGSDADATKFKRLVKNCHVEII
ncbi:MAG: MBL fold metallo-hydrolase [Terriglobia bacterium]|jgi:L-ascorbate metabolism protein UlaG (beta-lactamase superfamily)